MAGITGIRPIVDRYSITRYSLGEWRQHNKELLTKTYEVYENARMYVYYITFYKSCLLILFL